MNTLYLLLLLASVVCFALSSLSIHTKVNLVALGLLCWALVPFVQLAQAL